VTSMPHGALTTLYMCVFLYVMKSTHDDGDAVWKALAHSTRRQILDLLFGSPCTTGDLVSALALDRHVVMAHLAVLREADLVLTQKQGRHRLNYLNAVPLQQIHQRWVSPATGPWAAALLAVRDHAEAPHPHTSTADQPTQDRKSHG
jgi:DNA-binding transcriptional ArsR family regulator